LDPAIASKARKGDFVRCLDHLDATKLDKLSGISYWISHRIKRLR
jgi:hypothetical protein